MNVAELATVADEVTCLAADNIVTRSNVRIIAGAAREKERYHRILFLVFIGHCRKFYSIHKLSLLVVLKIAMLTFEFLFTLLIL